MQGVDFQVTEPECDAKLEEFKVKVFLRLMIDYTVVFTVQFLHFRAHSPTNSLSS